MALLLNLVTGRLLKPLVALFKILGAWVAGNRQGRTSERLRQNDAQRKADEKAKQARDRVITANDAELERLRSKWRRDH